MADTLAKSYAKSNSILHVDLRVASCYCSVMEIKEIRVARLRWLLDMKYPGHGALVRLEKATDRAANVYSQILNGHRNMGHSIARHLEKVHGLIPGIMDNALDPDPARQKLLDLVDEALAGTKQQPVARQPVPLRRNKKANVVRLHGRGNRQSEGNQSASRLSLKSRKKGA